MSERSGTGNGPASQEGAEPGIQLLRFVQLFSWIFLAILVSGSWYILKDWVFARSVLIGGVLANGSFYLLKRDIEQLIGRVSAATDGRKAVKRVEKLRFFLKFYARLIVLGLILYLLATRININMIGLVAGLSTVMLSVITVVLSRGKKIFSVQRYKGA